MTEFYQPDYDADTENLDLYKAYEDDFEKYL